MTEYITTEQCEEVVWEVLNNMGVSQKHNERTVDEVHGLIFDLPKVTEMIDMDSYKTLQTDLKDCRNELCLRCGDYKMAHKGACDDCRWRN